MSEEIKRLAKESLQKKWYPLRQSKNDNIDEWSEDCAFCDDTRTKSEYDLECDDCCIGLRSDTKDLICISIVKAHRNSNINIIIKALEELRDNGKLSPETIEYLENYEADY